MPDALGPEFLALQQVVAGRYALERELGRGGMGIVFLARDVALDRLVAIKLLPPALAAQPAHRGRFLAEARTAARLSQPNIVPIFAVEEAGELVFFVMAYVDGTTLGERLRERGPLTPHEAARLLQETAWALGYAHARGVVHRDVKPDNIMLEHGTGRAVVMDFGIAAAASGPSGGEVTGTAQYVSPEQAGAGAVDGRSDLYSLGVVLFLALTGRLPFEAGDVHGMLAMHIARPAPPLLSLAPGTPRQLAQAVDRCLAKQPADRFADGEALAAFVGASAEPRRQLPVPVRHWLLKAEEERTGWAIMWYGLFGTGLSWGAAFLVSLRWPVLAPWAAIATYSITPLVLYTASRLMRFRKLLAEGYTIEDARMAVAELVERRREEVTYEFGKEPPLWAKLDRMLMFASGAATFGLAALIMVTGDPRAGIAGIATAGIWIWTSVLQTFRPGRPITRDDVAEKRLKFWNSKLGRWFEKIARIGLKRRAVPAELTHRPTEMAISMAADALFESLPKSLRKDLKELPSVMQRLQGDAAMMRRTVDELNGALASLGDHPDPDLVQARDQAAKRLGEAVASLESVRLGLLKLKAGTGSMGELTADLTAARVLTESIDFAVRGHAEVERLLDKRSRTPPDPLIPSHA